jgi:hypothetical protein
VGVCRDLQRYRGDTRSFMRSINPDISINHVFTLSLAPSLLFLQIKRVSRESARFSKSKTDNGDNVEIIAKREAKNQQTNGFTRVDVSFLFS